MPARGGRTPAVRGRQSTRRCRGGRPRSRGSCLGSPAGGRRPPAARRRSVSTMASTRATAWSGVPRSRAASRRPQQLQGEAHEGAAERRRRVGEHPVAPVPDRQRLALDHPVGDEVLGGHEVAAAGRSAAKASASLPWWKWPACAEPVEEGGEVRNDHALTGSQRDRAGRTGRGVRGLLEDRPEQGDQRGPHGEMTTPPAARSTAGATTSARAGRRGARARGGSRPGTGHNHRAPGPRWKTWSEPPGEGDGHGTKWLHGAGPRRRPGVSTKKSNSVAPPAAVRAGGSRRRPGSTGWALATDAANPRRDDGVQRACRPARAMSRRRPPRRGGRHHQPAAHDQSCSPRSGRPPRSCTSDSVRTHGPPEGRSARRNRALPRPPGCRPR